MPFPIGRVRVILTGFAGAPGLSQFYWVGASSITFTSADATAAIAAVWSLLTSSSSAFANTVAMQVQSTVEILEATNGALLGSVVGTPQASVAGSASGNVLTAEGPLIQWFTGDVVNRRLVRGRTFLTPSAASALDSTGRVLPAVISAVDAACATYVGISPQQPVIWHRPKPYKTGSNGSHHLILAGNVPDKVAVLRSRRD